MWVDSVVIGGMHTGPVGHELFCSHSVLLHATPEARVLSHGKLQCTPRQLRYAETCAVRKAHLHVKAYLYAETTCHYETVILD